jgi:alpha-glucosidase
MAIVIEQPGPSSEQRRSQSREWWRTAVIYEIYTRSFYDSDGDGNGDLNGIADKLWYLQSLGVDAIWLTPFFESPAKDQGYDPASYHKVDAKFGNNADMRRLIREAHGSGIKVILDLVLNHTSDRHPWFLRALTTEMKERRVKSGYDYAKDPAANVYVFRPPDPVDSARPPNNWKHFMGDESAWTKTKEDEWYLHRFTPNQPDLDQRNPLVRRHFAKIVSRWVRDQHIDGVRIDVLDHVFHDKKLRDFQAIPSPSDNNYLAKWNWAERYLLDDEATELARELSKAIKSANPSAVSISEMHYGPDVSDFVHYARFFTDGKIDVPFNFSLLDAVQKFGASGREWKNVIDRYINALPKGACPNFVLSNHDQTARLVDKVGIQNIRSVMMGLLCLGDTCGSNIFLYNGDEIGMTKNEIINYANQTDPVGLMQGLELSRDHVRTGLVWDTAEVNAGFSQNSKPWLPAGKTVSGSGVMQQIADPLSQLVFVQKLLGLRRAHEALRFGKYIPIEAGDDSVYCFGRRSLNETDEFFVIFCNFSARIKTAVFSGAEALLVLATRDTTAHERVTRIDVQPNEGCLFRIIPNSAGSSVITAV